MIRASSLGHTRPQNLGSQGLILILIPQKTENCCGPNVEVTLGYNGVREVQDTWRESNPWEMSLSVPAFLSYTPSHSRGRVGDRVAVAPSLRRGK